MKSVYILLIGGLLAFVSAVGFTSDEIKKDSYAAVCVSDDASATIVKDLAILVATPARVTIDKGRDNPFAALWVEKTADGYSEEVDRPPVV